MRASQESVNHSEDTDRVGRAMDRANGESHPAAVDADVEPPVPAFMPLEIWNGWPADLVVAYLGGIAFGAPGGLVVVWLSKMPAALTIAMVLAMGGVLMSRWRRRRKSQRDRSPTR
jgi:hypothetical protein